MCGLTRIVAFYYRRMPTSAPVAVATSRGGSSPVNTVWRNVNRFWETTRRTEGIKMELKQRVLEAFKELGVLLKRSARAWSRDNGSRMAAALAFYAAFSIAPLLLLSMGVASVVFDEEVVSAQLAAHLNEFAGPRIEEYVWEVVERWQDRQAGLQATLVALVALGWGAFRGFDAVRATLNMVWDVEKRSGAAIYDRLARRAGTFVLMLCVGGLTIASVLFSTVLTWMAQGVEETVWFAMPAVQRLETVGSMLIVSVLFAMIFKWAANVEIRWRDALVGATFTAGVFAIGKYGVELFLTYVATTSVFGAAGALVLLLLWVYLSAMIFFYGAEFTKFWARRYGVEIRPDSTAVRVRRLVEVRRAIVDTLGEEAARQVDQKLGIEPEGEQRR